MREVLTRIFSNFWYKQKVFRFKEFVSQVGRTHLNFESQMVWFSNPLPIPFGRSLSGSIVPDSFLKFETLFIGLFINIYGTCSEKFEESSANRYLWVPNWLLFKSMTLKFGGEWLTCRTYESKFKKPVQIDGSVFISSRLLELTRIDKFLKGFFRSCSTTSLLVETLVELL